VAAITLEHVTKAFKGKAAVRDLNFEVADGEFVIVVGPSGCGKTTTLRMLAGFETPTQGTLRIGGKVVNDVAPKDRNLAMVFQNYALFPHMSVAKNLSFGMRVRGESKRVIERDVAEIAGMLGIEALLGRKPSELSGGERQRVALGRALLRRPDAFLLDEPLSNLDAALRGQMRVELKRIHEKFGVTTVYVTHDQVEAMTMADRIALMHKGRLQQMASPETIYERPANSFVAAFIGAPKINLLAGTLIREGGRPVIDLLSCKIPVNGTLGTALLGAPRQTLLVGLRPEEIRPSGLSGRALPVVQGTVEVIEPLGAETHVTVRAGNEVLTCRFPARTGLEVGGPITLELDIEQMKIFDRESGESIC
jgi:multiple sugar transport system ATP-binding protein